MLDGKGRCTVIERFSRRPGHLVTVGAADVENEGDDDAGAILPVSAMYKDRSTCKPIREHFQGLSGKSGTLATSERRGWCVASQCTVPYKQHCFGTSTHLPDLR